MKIACPICDKVGGLFWEANDVGDEIWLGCNYCQAHWDLKHFCEDDCEEWCTNEP